jgi:hypothetical protein
LDLGRSLRRMSILLVHSQKDSHARGGSRKMEGSSVKHVKQITKKVPSSATTAEEVLCSVVQFLSALLGGFGGASPVLGFLMGPEKCGVPEDANTTP